MSQSAISVDLDILVQCTGLTHGTLFFDSRLPNGHDDATLVPVRTDDDDHVELRAEYNGDQNRAHAWITIDRESLFQLADELRQEQPAETDQQEVEDDV